MKKSLITILTLLLVLINLVLTALLTFTILPQTKKANELITKVAGAIELDLTSGEAVSANGNTSLDDQKVYTLSEKLTTNLKKGDDGEAHYAVLDKITLTINTKSQAYEKYNESNINSYDGIITDTIGKVVASYTVDEFQSQQADAQEEVREELAESFGGDLISKVSWTTTIQ